MQDTNLKPTIKIEWLSDYSDCEQCGGNYADGAKVWLDGNEFLDLTPHASCFGGDHWDSHTVYEMIIKSLGYNVETGY